MLLGSFDRGAHHRNTVTVLLPLDVVGEEDTLHWHTSPRHRHVPALDCTRHLSKASVLSPEDIANGLRRLDAVRGHGVSYPQHLPHELAHTRDGVSLRYVHAHGLQPTPDQGVPPQPRIPAGVGGGERGASARARGGGFHSRAVTHRGAGDYPPPTALKPDAPALVWGVGVRDPPPVMRGETAGVAGAAGAHFSAGALVANFNAL